MRPVFDSVYVGGNPDVLERLLRQAGPARQVSGVCRLCGVGSRRSALKCFKDRGRSCLRKATSLRKIPQHSGQTVSLNSKRRE